jgi:hypothetical protein
MDNVLLIVDGRYWCGFFDAAFFDKVLLIVDGRYWCPIPTIYDEENVIKERCITETTPISTRGRSRGVGAHPARAPPKIGKNMIFWGKIVIFHTKYPKNF